MKSITFFLGILLSFYSFGQKNPIDAFAPGDTVTIIVERTADRLGTYDTDTFNIIKTKLNWIAYSHKKNKWYVADIPAQHALKHSVDEGIKKKRTTLPCDHYKLIFKSQTISFTLHPTYLNDFMDRLKLINNSLRPQ